MLLWLLWKPIPFYTLLIYRNLREEPIVPRYLHSIFFFIIIFNFLIFKFNFNFSILFFFIFHIFLGFFSMQICRHPKLALFWNPCSNSKFRVAAATRRVRSLCTCPALFRTSAIFNRNQSDHIVLKAKMPAKEVLTAAMLLHYNLLQYANPKEENYNVKYS